MAFEVNVPWIAAIGANYHVGIDGISMPLFVLSYLLTFLCSIYSFHHIEEPGKPKAFLALMLHAADRAWPGRFIAFDLVLFFVFWELVLVPMYFMIGIWGGPRRRVRRRSSSSSTRCSARCSCWSRSLALYFSDPGADLRHHRAHRASGQAGEFTADVPDRWRSSGIGLSFAIKAPMWPFHTWLPDAHTEAPTVGSVLLAGVLLKMGTYGFVRIALPILPEGAMFWAPIIAVLAVIAIIYGALCCLAQTDLKRLIAFSSVGPHGLRDARHRDADAHRASTPRSSAWSRTG